MLKYLKKIVIFVFLTSCILLNGQEIDYKKDFHNLLTTTKSDDEIYNLIENYFKSFDDIQLPIALGKITNDMDYHTVVHLIGITESRLESISYTAGLINEISKNDNSDGFRIATIELIQKIVIKRNNLKEIQNFNAVTYDIAKNNVLSDELREYAAQNTARYTDYKTNKTILSELINNKNYAVKNGAAKSVRRLLLNNLSSDEDDYWAELLVKNIDDNIKLTYSKSLIITLGYSNSEIAKEYLTSLFGKNENSDIIALSLSQFHDNEILKCIFNKFPEKDSTYNFQKELLLSTIVQNNVDILEKFSSSKNDDETIIFLRGIRLIQDNEKNKKMLNKDKISSLLYSDSESVRLETIKSIHFTYPYEEEKLIFLNHLNKEYSDKVKALIYSYIGFVK
ncbi:MAG: hypothetical protein ACLFQM_09320 [Fidelibacterota bacterium]